MAMGSKPGEPEEMAVVITSPWRLGSDQASRLEVGAVGARVRLTPPGRAR